MGHKTITISEEAYLALSSVKEKNESFTKVILRLTQKKKAGTLLDYVRSLEPDEEFAEIMKTVLEEREGVTLRAPRI